MTTADAEVVERMRTDQARADAQYRSRFLLVLAAAVSSAVVMGLLAASADRPTLHTLFLVLSVVTLLSLLNISWWVIRPLVGPWQCPPAATPLNGAAALSLVLLVSVGTLVLVNALTEGNPL